VKRSVGLCQAAVKTKPPSNITITILDIIHRPVFYLEFLATDPEVWVRFLELPDFQRSSGSLSLVSTIEELLGRKRSGLGLENREYGLRDPSR
jgi:hypothetical protein